MTSPFKKNNTAELSVDIPPQMTNGMQAYSSNNGAPNSPAPFIKNEPQDDTHRFSQQGGFNHHPDAYSMSAGGNSNFGHDDFADSIDPSALSMPVQQNGGFMQGFGSLQQGGGGMSYMGGGGGGIDDEDLLATLDQDRPNGHYDAGHQDQYNHQQDTMSHYFNDVDDNKNGVSSAQNIDSHSFSHTPDNAPIGSPYIRSFPQQYRQLQSYNGATAETPSSYNASPVIGSNSTQGTNFDQYMTTAKRKTRPEMERAGSQRSPIGISPHTPKTPALAGLSLGPESSSLPGKPITNSHMGHRKSQSISSHWDGTPGSYMDSPLSSPAHGPGSHPGISEIFSGKHASLPAKVDNGMGGAFQTQEAKRRRRRESHNMVERRRRDNINERIQELSHLVPQHRLEDEKVRKQLINNGSLSPTAGASGSPPRATSMLAGGMGRRASGVPTSAGLAGEEKDKGPNKGDILNGAVGWTRDLMWALHQKYEQEQEVRKLLTSLGQTYPFEQTEEEKRMASELQKAVGKNGPHTFRYSRAPGTNLRVPGYTDYAGQAVDPNDRVSPAASNGKGGSSRGTPQRQFWNQGDGVTFKEEDEFGGMDMT